MSTIPVIYLEDAPLSNKLKSLLSDISIETGRTIFFIDINKIAKNNPSGMHLVKAQVISEPNKPYIAIELDVNRMSKSLYNPKIHDPLIAHEAFHPLLWSRGYLPLIGINSSDEELHWVHLANNWIADPIINMEIHKLGFDISIDKTHELRSSIKPLNKRVWASKPFIESLQLAVAFLLEPNISQDVRTEFRAALKRGLGISAYQKIDGVFKKIKSLDFSTADNYQQSALTLIKYLSSEYQLHLNSPTFSEPFSKYSEDDINAWINQEIIETEPWP